MNRRELMTWTGATMLGAGVAQAADPVAEDGMGLQGVPRTSVEELVASLRKEGFQWRFIGRQLRFTAVVLTAGTNPRVRIDGMDKDRCDTAVLRRADAKDSFDVGQKVAVRGLIVDQWFGVWQVWCYTCSIV